MDASPFWTSVNHKKKISINPHASCFVQQQAMSDMVKVDENARAPSPVETYAQNQMRRAIEAYALNKLKRKDRAEETDIQARENHTRERKTDIAAQQHSLAMRKYKDTAEVLEDARKRYEAVKDQDDMVEESGSIDSFIAFKYRTIIEDWPARYNA